MSEKKYPYVPKSTTKMCVGDYWPIRLKNGKYACGIVVSILVNENGKRNTRSFLAGLLDWTGSVPPSAKLLSGAKLVRVGFVHIKTITVPGASIEGNFSLECDYPEIIEDRHDISSWGYNFINLLADDL